MDKLEIKELTKDDILRECATLFSNLGIDSTDEDRKKAKEREWFLLSMLKDIDREEYEFYKRTRDL
tara:strand:+ start:230 stop:427 length:198 start_codon:yes stop_codon:yes gene_type:complete